MRRAVLFLILSLSPLASVPAFDGPVLPTIYRAGPGTTDYPWTMFHRDTLRLGASSASAPSTAGLAWNYPTGAQVYASPAVSDGMVFIPSWDGVLYALDEYSGQLRWSFNTGTAIYASPAVSNGMVYVASRNGFMYALNELNGAMVWRTGNPNFPITSSPLVANGRVFYGNWCLAVLCNPPGKFMALDANTGAILWTNQTAASAPVISSPSIHNGVVFFGQNDGSVVALNQTTGVQIWGRTLSFGIVVSTAPAVAYGMVFVGTGNRFAAVDESTGSVIWTRNDGNSNATSAAVAGGVVYYGTGRGNLFAVVATTGTTVWSTSTGSGISSSPALALGSNVLLVGSNDGYMYAFNLADGSQVWRYQTSGAVSSSPAVADTRVFFGSQDSRVYALGAAIPPLPTLQVQLSRNPTSLKPGEVSYLTITVTNGTAPESGASVTLTSSAGGGFTPPVEQTPGQYISNYTAPLVTSVTTATIQAQASKAGFQSGSATTSITLNPFPPLVIYVTPKPAKVSPGGEVVLVMMVLNGTSPVTGASIFLSSTGGGTFSSPIDDGTGNYTAIYSAGLQSSSQTLVVQASKTGFAPGTAQVTVTVSGVPDLTGVKIVGIPLFVLIAAFFLLAFVVFIAIIRGKKESDFAPRYVPPPAYMFRRRLFREGLSKRFQASFSLGLAAIAGS